MTPHDDARYQQLLNDGFCIFENLVDSNMLANLRQRTDQVLDAQDEDNRRQPAHHRQYVQPHAAPLLRRNHHLQTGPGRAGKPGLSTADL